MTEPQNKPANCMEKFRPVLLTLAKTMISPTLRGNLEASDLVQLTLLEAHRNIDQLVVAGVGPIFRLAPQSASTQCSYGFCKRSIQVSLGIRWYIEVSYSEYWF